MKKLTATRKIMYPTSDPYAFDEKEKKHKNISVLGACLSEFDMLYCQIRQVNVV